MRRFLFPTCLGLLIWGTSTGPEGLTEKPADIASQAVARIPAVPAEAAPSPPSSPYADMYEIPDPVAEPVPAVLSALGPIVKPIIARTRAEICEGLTGAAQSNNLPTPFFIRLLYQESSFRPGMVSRAGAEGIAQFMPETSAHRGLDNPYDPLQAIAASARLLRDLAQRFGNLGLAAAAYNAGPKRIADWLNKKGKLPQETQDYVKSITGRPAELWLAAERGSPAVKLQRHAPCQEAAGLLAWDGPSQIPLPPTRTRPASGGTAKLATRGLVRTAKRGAKVAKAGIPAAGKAPAKDAGKQVAREENPVGKHAVHLAVARPKHHRVHLTER